MRRNKHKYFWNSANCFSLMFRFSLYIHCMMFLSWNKGLQNNQRYSQVFNNRLMIWHQSAAHEEYAEVESILRSHLESFLETARSFNMIYTKEIHPWTHMMEVPQLPGFGPAAIPLLEAYKMLLKISTEVSWGLIPFITALLS
ncbi:putative plant AUGMIN subunit 7 protein [Rosa chinensis]|uniref:Putative plant AUGMIN subunit 7 protein n=1 Tax=Rosa chinensis TaxID=74649 RepID=A0A2P6SE36_ROSCH|nr:putative plant AUGMIN subunit 7 protein [Rosa chinensis]